MLEYQYFDFELSILVRTAYLPVFILNETNHLNELHRIFCLEDVMILIHECLLENLDNIFSFYNQKIRGNNYKVCLFNDFYFIKY